MKIKLIYSKNLSDPTGASTVMRLHAESAEYYAKSGFDFQVLARDTILKVNTGLGNSSVSGKASVKRRMTEMIGRYSKYSPTAAYIYAYIRSFRPAKRLNNILGRYIDDNDILFFNEMIPCYYYLRKYGKGNHKIVAMFHNDGEDFTAGKNATAGFESSWVFRKLVKMQRFVTEQVDMLGFVSECSARRYLELHPWADAQKVFHIPNGIKPIPERNNTIATPLEIVCVGTVNDRKNQEAIVRALVRCKDEGKQLGNLHFTIVGGGERLDYLKKLAESHRLEQQVTFAGNSRNVDAFLMKANIFILPSISEGLPMAILEAMRMSLPIVSTRTGGIPETIINGKTGLLIDSTADGVYSFITHIDQYDWKEMGHASYLYFCEKFTEEKMLDSYIEMFKSLI